MLGQLAPDSYGLNVTIRVIFSQREKRVSQEKNEQRRQRELPHGYECTSSKKKETRAQLQRHYLLR